MKKLIIGAALAATVLGGGTAIALTQQDNGPEGWLLRHGDTNNDGAISREEFMKKAAEHFAKLDTNKDGKISLAEFKAVREMHHRGPGWHGHGGPGGPEGGPGMMPPPPGGPGGPGSDMLARLDTNGDGKISRAEFAVPGDKHFDMIDTNHDGQIDQTEIAAAREKMRARMEQMRAAWRGGPTGPGGDMPPPPPPPPGNDK